MSNHCHFAIYTETSLNLFEMCVFLILSMGLLRLKHFQTIGLYCIIFMIVIYNCNAIGQYYKTTVIDYNQS
jgi:hypothetical protein